jgi:hypothetical protein
MFRVELMRTEEHGLSYFVVIINNLLVLGMCRLYSVRFIRSRYMNFIKNQL